jgi:hypothetical protein
VLTATLKLLEATDAVELVVGAASPPALAARLDDALATTELTVEEATELGATDDVIELTITSLFISRI